MSYTPVEASAHNINILFNNERVPGSPFISNVYDTSTINVDFDALRIIGVRKPAKFDINLSGMPDAGVEVTVTGEICMLLYV